MNKLFWIIVVLAIGVAAWLMFGNNNPDKDNSPSNSQQQNQSDTNDQSQNTTAPTDQNQEDNVWYGILKPSNDSTRGNLMLEVSDSDRIIYIHTARDFSTLYGKSVKVNFEGDLTGFRLIDIIEE